MRFDRCSMTIIKRMESACNALAREMASAIVATLNRLWREGFP